MRVKVQADWTRCTGAVRAKIDWISTEEFDLQKNKSMVTQLISRVAAGGKTSKGNQWCLWE
jgi:hypothetical protein